MPRNDRRATVVGVESAFEANKMRFLRQFPDGQKLLDLLNRHGWKPSYLRPTVESPLGAPCLSGSWVMRARPSPSTAEAFDLQVEVLFVLSPFHDLQARMIDAMWALVRGDERVARDVAFFVSSDDDGDAKIDQMQHGQGVVLLTWSWIQDSQRVFPVVRRPLRERLERFLYARNLFDVKTPVTGSRFFGRRQDLQHLRARVTADEPIGLFGLRKIGKTSLLNSLADDLSDWTSGLPIVLCAQIDLQGVPFDAKSDRYLLWTIGNALARSWNHHPAHRLARRHFAPKFFGIYDEVAHAPAVVSVAFDSDLKRLIRCCESADAEVHVVVMLDEIERLLPPSGSEEAFTNAVELLRYFRGLNQQGIGFSFVLVGANPYFAERRFLLEQENPLLNFTVTHYVGLFSEEEAGVMISRLGKPMGLDFQRDTKQRIFRLVGGHPYLTRQLCSEASQTLPPERPCTVGVDAVDKALPSFIAHQQPTFGQMWDSLKDYPDERYLLAQLAAGDADFVDRYARQDPLAVQHLIGYGLVANTVIGYDFAIPVVRSFLLALQES